MANISMEITPESLSEFINNLAILSNKMNRQTTEAVREGGKVAKEIYRAVTPAKSGNAKSSVDMENVSTSGFYKSIKVGYGSSSYWYMWFVHEGTYSKGNPKGISPRKHIERALPTMFASAQDVMTAEVREALGGW
ncbi:HK97-gp10 family putative phage morphogenesis protein [Eremococcus coleocola]|uniref:HK97-gp10 family putative phage morphogenesis protein n=1 Tax=Eremococcus coleocola TaxID=88132 RepID=UPI000489BA4C|nr:HK97-gp10 family putative phage morphogenesis protein [Eremococcus coleocola]